MYHIKRSHNPTPTGQMFSGFAPSIQIRFKSKGFQVLHFGWKTQMSLISPSYSVEHRHFSHGMTKNEFWVVLPLVMSVNFAEHHTVVE